MRQPLYSLQIIRAIAAVMVVITHLGGMILRKTGHDFTPATAIGSAGVDLFFIVSGFVMVHTTSREFDARGFLLRRLLRVAPLYWFATLLYGLMVIAAPDLFAVYRLKTDNFIAALLFLPSFNAQGEIRPPLQQGWTLAYEMFFYLCFAIASRLAFNRRSAVIGCGFALLVLMGRLVPVQHSAILSCYTDPLLLEFVAGCVLADLHRRRHLDFSKTTAVLCLCAATAGLVVSGALMRADCPRLIYWGLPAFLAVLGLLRLEQFVPLARFRLALAIGDSSYALYLTHAFVLAVVGLGFRLDPARALGALPVAIIAMGLCLSVGWLCHRWIEQPLTGVARRRLQTKLPRTNSQPVLSGRR